eukprot:g12295.t1
MFVTSKHSRLQRRERDWDWAEKYRLARDEQNLNSVCKKNPRGASKMAVACFFRNHQNFEISPVSSKSRTTFDETYSGRRAPSRVHFCLLWTPPWQACITGDCVIDRRKKKEIFSPVFPLVFVLAIFFKLSAPNHHSQHRQKLGGLALHLGKFSTWNLVKPSSDMHADLPRIPTTCTPQCAFQVLFQGLQEVACNSVTYLLNKKNSL